MASTDPSSQPYKLDIWRYLRALIFFGQVTLNILFWEVLVRNVLGSRLANRRRTFRLRRYAARFRGLAVRMGGVMIKLGQFVSARVDVIPAEIIDELAGLQDEVPPAPFEIMRQTLRDEFGAPPEDLFAEFDPQTVAAASLGQVYRANLKENGRPVAIKVLRPDIERIVATDLRSLRVVARWMMAWPLIRRRADVPVLLDEFAATLWQELDYEAEAGNAERFKELFAGDERVYIPHIYREHSTRRVLTMQDVTAIKITDREALDTAGVDRARAARWLLDLYLKMIFDFGFFHADPHPGNLFIYPVRSDANHRFVVVFVDFGMVGTISQQVKDGLREGLIAVGTRDSRRVLKAYQMLGVLLPSADLARIEEAEQEALDYIWGKSVSEVAGMGHQDMHRFMHEYRDLLYEMPFQVPQNFIYLARAMGILSGICTLLDPDFNPWEQVAEYAQRMIGREMRRDLPGLVREAASLGQSALALPRRLDEVVSRLDRLEAYGFSANGHGTGTDLRRLQHTHRVLTRTVLFAGFLVTGTVFYTSGMLVPGIAGWALSGAAGLSAVMAGRPRRRVS